MKIKQSKEFKKKKYEAKGKNKRRGLHDGEDDYQDDDMLARDMLFNQTQPLPGQLANCELCEKRFTVTAYSKTGPDGGLLCTKCSKEMKAEEKKQQPKQQPKQRGKRRQIESARMMGDVKPGAKSLVDICVRAVADNIVDIEEFGLLPQSLLDRLSKVLSRRRVINSRTLELFLQPDSDKISIYDAASLQTDDFEKIFSHMPELEQVDLRNAGQLKDSVVYYLLDHNPHITHLTFEASNLISNAAWTQFFIKLGPSLQSFKTSWLDNAMDDTVIETLARQCSNLKRLNMKVLWLPTEASLNSISTLTNLEHLSLSFNKDACPEVLNNLITSTGANLRTLSLETYQNADDTTLAAIHSTCTQLSKLRLTENTICTDAGFAELFTHWPNRPLSIIDFHDMRSCDANNPDGPSEPVGLASAGFAAMIAHSGRSLTNLNIKSCRHISRDALLSAFDAAEIRCPVLKELDMSFCHGVTDEVVYAIFKSCPKLEKLVIFGCNLSSVVGVPVGLAVIGLIGEAVVVEGGFEKRGREDKERGLGLWP